MGGHGFRFGGLVGSIVLPVQLVRQAVHILTDLGDDAFAFA